ncbi:uncharacterized protein TNIN_73871 [Trichonephila inaurata madagascariensis]|uniref:Uncharacterized protein n=1 Tax=Trichonephila inaurata madagascariensis TaxID=2747483 RepID=A0A8X6Y183_9ARAC|nr:uncharacterized protein TNIN_73871 [Trichonephila inaurata madagascariensis]
MGNSNSCYKLNLLCFEWKKRKFFRKNKRDLSENVVRLQKDGSVAIENLASFESIPNYSYTRWDCELIRNEGNNLRLPQSTDFQSVELVSLPSEDKYVNKYLNGENESHLKISLMNTLPPPIPPRNVGKSSDTDSLQVNDEQVTSEMNKAPSMETLLAYTQNYCAQQNAIESKLSSEIARNTQTSDKRILPRIAPSVLETAPNEKLSVGNETRSWNKNSNFPPPIPPRQRDIVNT